MWSETALPEAFIVGYFALLGAVLGSFLNVCILRWGAEPKQSVLRPPSRCPICGRAIRWYENIPILSWLFLRGKCAGCGARISLLYPAIEATTALLWGGSVALLGLGLPAIELAVAATLLLGIAVSDARAFIIPHEFSLGGTAIALAFAAWPEPVGLLDAIQGALFGAGLVLLFGELSELVLGQEAMGGGDCALMGMVGAFFGWESALAVLCLGAVISIVLLVLAGLHPRTPDARTMAAEPRPSFRWGQLLDLIGELLQLVRQLLQLIRWGQLFKLLSGLLGLGGLLVMAVVVVGPRAILNASFAALLGGGAAYYVSLVLPKRVIGGLLMQVWGLLGAAVGVAVGTAHWRGILAGVVLGAGALAWASRQTVVAAPETTDELRKQWYVPLGVGLSIAAGLLAFTGAFGQVREVFAEIARGVGP